jgi:hypothetical protein
MLFRRRRKTYLEGLTEGRRRAAADVRAYADHEERRIAAAHAERGTTADHGLVGNWLGGIRDAALVIERRHPYFPTKDDPHPWKSTDAGQ